MADDQKPKFDPEAPYQKADGGASSGGFDPNAANEAAPKTDEAAPPPAHPSKNKGFT